MFKVWETNNRKMCLYITITCKGKRKFRVASSAYEKINSKYSDRQIEVDGTRTIYLSFPVTPSKLIIGVQDLENKAATDFDVSIEERPLKEYAIWVDEPTRSFVDLAENFSQRCGYEAADAKGRFARSKDRQFNIKFLPVIKDYATGNVLSTPARIAHKSGIIEVSKAKFNAYTIPMRMMILLHEYSHKYKNPTIGLPISDEIGADIWALYIYLGKGYSKIDAITVYANVFLKAQTEGNMQRMRKIVDYIDKFCQGEFAKPMI